MSKIVRRYYSVREKAQKLVDKWTEEGYEAWYDYWFDGRWRASRGNKKVRK